MASTRKYAERTVQPDTECCPLCNSHFSVETSDIESEYVVTEFEPDDGNPIRNENRFLLASFGLRRALSGNLVIPISGRVYDSYLEFGVLFLRLLPATECVDMDILNAGAAKALLPSRNHCSYMLEPGLLPPGEDGRGFQMPDILPTHGMYSSVWPRRTSSGGLTLCTNPTNTIAMNSVAGSFDGSRVLGDSLAVGLEFERTVDMGGGVAGVNFLGSRYVVGSTTLPENQPSLFFQTSACGNSNPSVETAQGLGYINDMNDTMSFSLNQEMEPWLLNYSQMSGRTYNQSSVTSVSSLVIDSRGLMDWHTFVQSPTSDQTASLAPKKTSLRVSAADAQPAPLTSRPFICDIRGCSHTYKRIHELRRHKRTHLSVKPHACHFPLCNRSGRNGFVRKDHLKQHMRQVHHHV
ncbi:hypothetical protein DL98DRAFT_571964 [Cadophora sp. DSE1049]|nr:hypothetical protein DL98DRAFT_571964 [Cadophora sp. DSE1049]